MKHPLQQAEFLCTAANDEQLPPPGPPEIAFAGRSNAGKSSAINALANRARLAFTSKTPGRTQQINFFQLRPSVRPPEGGLAPPWGEGAQRQGGTSESSARPPEGGLAPAWREGAKRQGCPSGLLADLPGYGYAAVPKELKRHWQEFLARYLATRQSLVGLVLVVDIRHGIAALDLQLLSSYLPSSRPVLILASKCDKLTPSAQRLAQRDLQQSMSDAFPPHAGRVTVVAFSALRRIGIEAAEATIANWLGIEYTPPKPSRVAAAQKKRPRNQGE